MAVKIAVDAGHGGSDPGAVYQGRLEKDDNLKLALAVGKILESRGIDVIYTRTTDIYQTPFEKATIANKAGADYFLSIHRNSFPVQNTAKGVESLIYDKSGIKLDIAENIDGNLANLGFVDLGVKARPNLVVLKRTNMPAVLVEAGFINSNSDNQLFDKQFNNIAQAIADGILDTIQAEGEDVYYRVQIGAYKQRDNAEKLLNKVTAAGYPAFLIYDNGLYKVQVGAFKNLNNAIAMEARLRKDGYSTFITT